MASRPVVSSAMSLLRLRVATNLFKVLLLGDLHIQRNPQVSAVFDALSNAGCEQQFSERTWHNWFSKSPIVPKFKKAQALDILAAHALRKSAGDQTETGLLPEGAFSALIHGGLVRSLTAPSEAKKLLPVMVARAHEYEPLSALHLHLDAIEISAQTKGAGDIHWTAVKALGAERILNLLAARWNPRRGTVYSELPSDMAIKWEKATHEEKTVIRESCARFKPDLFQYSMEKAPHPDWNIVGVEADIAGMHIYKLLFAIAADSKFLVADRLSAWSLDLATAALAMHALAWVDRYKTFGAEFTSEMAYWRAFNLLLFKEETPTMDQFDLISAMEVRTAAWDANSIQTLLRGGETYRETLTELGTSSAEVLTIAMQGAQAHPLVYRA